MSGQNQHLCNLYMLWCIGGIAGYNQGGTIENCHVTCTVTISNTTANAETDYVDFVGMYSPTVIYESGTAGIRYRGSDADYYDDDARWNDKLSIELNHNSINNYWCPLNLFLSGQPIEHSQNEGLGMFKLIIQQYKPPFIINDFRMGMITRGHACVRVNLVEKDLVPGMVMVLEVVATGSSNGLQLLIRNTSAIRSSNCSHTFENMGASSVSLCVMPCTRWHQ